MAKIAESTRRGRAWKTKLPNVEHAISPSHTTRPNPLVSGDRLYVSVFAPGAIYALNRQDGSLLWSYQLDTLGSSDVAAYRGLIFAKSSRTLFALDGKDGSVRWHFAPKEAPGEWIYSQPTIKDGFVLIGDRCGYLHCLQATTGAVVWQRLVSKADNNDVNTTAVVVGQRVITGNNDGAIVCYVLKTGETLWRRNVDAGCGRQLARFRSKIAISARSLYLLDLKTGRYKLRVSRAKKSFGAICATGTGVAAILETDFHACPGEWGNDSAFNTELLLITDKSENTLRRLRGSPALRMCSETGLLFAANHYGLTAIDPSNGSVVFSRPEWIALPDCGSGWLYGLEEDGTVFAERISGFREM